MRWHITRWSRWRCCIFTDNSQPSSRSFFFGICLTIPCIRFAQEPLIYVLHEVYSRLPFIKIDTIKFVEGDNISPDFFVYCCLNLFFVKILIIGYPSYKWQYQIKHGTKVLPVLTKVISYRLFPITNQQYKLQVILTLQFA